MSEARLDKAREAASGVVDPELPVLTIAELGVLREVSLAADGVIEVAITPTYTGCPAMVMIATEVEAALARAGVGPVRVRSVLSPAWSSDWVSREGRQKLAAAGIAPPATAQARRALFGEERVVCPRCGSHETERISEFGSTACKALWRCLACREPFDAFKCH